MNTKIDWQAVARKLGFPRPGFQMVPAPNGTGSYEIPEKWTLDDWFEFCSILNSSDSSALAVKKIQKIFEKYPKEIS